MTRDINELLPIVKVKCQALVDECKKQSISLTVTGTYRSIEEQNGLYNQGRTTPGQIITNAKGGQSLHNWRVAFDIVPIVNGAVQYNDDVLWAKIAKIGASIGLEWGGSWVTFPDKPHFQFTQGYDFPDFQSGKVDMKKFDIPIIPTTPQLSREQIKGEIVRLLNLL